MINQLAQEKSPYLRQHANNPVAWRPWTSEAFEHAAKEQKPIFLSIGYATCHWCHVMEGDSFEDPNVARLINENYVAIKVDREERPDIDQIYMRAVQALTGRGGWPLTTILTPDGKPFWGGTFLTKEQLQQLLQQINKLWHSAEREKILASAENIHQALAEDKNKQPTDLGNYKEAFLANCRSRFDEAYGGFSVSPKFPPSMTLMTLMRLKFTADEAAESRKMVVKTLEQMAMSGLCDQLSGGFHRYATDRGWKIPHFEKMLYDNALLTMAYLDAGVKYQRSEFIDIANKTLTYMLSCLESPKGGFYSGEDADSENSEGKYYLWSIEELKRILTDEEFTWINNHFEISDSGNFHVDPRVEELERAAGYVPLPENVNILHARSNAELSALVSHKAQGIFNKLNSIRNERVRPFRDEKVLTGWNGLAIAALARGYVTSKEDSFLHAAQKAASFISENLVADSFLYRRWCDGEVKHRGVLEDYAFLIYGLVELYEADFNEQWLTLALKVQGLQDSLFWSVSDGLFFDHDGQDKTLIHRANDFFDNATPSGNSVSVLNLKRLYVLTGKEDYRAKAERIVNSSSQALLTYPQGLPFFCMSTDYFINESFLLVTNAADQTLDQIRDFSGRKHFLPHLLLGKMNASSNFSALKKEPQANAQGDVFQLCSEKGCQLPVTTIEAALQALRA